MGIDRFKGLGVLLDYINEGGVGGASEISGSSIGLI